MPKLIRPRYLVSLADRAEPVPVTILHADQLVGEELARREGLPVNPGEAPQLHTTLYVYAALQRMGEHPGPWSGFSELVEGIEADRDLPVDPTVPDQGTGSP